MLTKTGLSRTAMVAIVMGVVWLLLTTTVSADHNKFRFKWPYTPDSTVGTTTLPFSGVHNCSGGSGTNAWDFTIPNSDVRVSAEGVIAAAKNDILPNTCNVADGLGNFVRVLTLGAPLGNISMSYAHFASTPYSASDVGERVFQGDPLGIQGHTGHTEGTTPPLAARICIGSSTT